MKKYLKSFSIIILLFLVSIYSTNLITDYVFENQPFHFMGDAPFDLENIEKVSKKPSNSKAILSFEDNSLNIILPKDAQYIQEIMPEINIINYKISKLQNKLISNYITVDEELDQSRIFETSKTIKELLIFSFIFFSGVLINIFNQKSYFLLSFNYVRQFLAKIIYFSSIVISIIIISNVLTDYIFIERLFFISISSVILVNIFSNNFIKGVIFLISLYLYFLPPFEINYNYFFILSITINFIISFFMVKNINIIKTDKTKEENVND